MSEWSLVSTFTVLVLIKLLPSCTLTIYSFKILWTLRGMNQNPFFDPNSLFGSKFRQKRARPVLGNKVMCRIKYFVRLKRLRLNRPVFFKSLVILFWGLIYLYTSYFTLSIFLCGKAIGVPLWDWFLLESRKFVNHVCIMQSSTCRFFICSSSNLINGVQRRVLWVRGKPNVLYFLNQAVKRLAIWQNLNLPLEYCKKLFIRLLKPTWLFGKKC